MEFNGFNASPHPNCCRRAQICIQISSPFTGNLGCGSRLAACAKPCYPAGLFLTPVAKRWGWGVKEQKPNLGTWSWKGLYKQHFGVLTQCCLIKTALFTNLFKGLILSYLLWKTCLWAGLNACLSLETTEQHSETSSILEVKTCFPPTLRFITSDCNLPHNTQVSTHHTSPPPNQINP